MAWGRPKFCQNQKYFWILSNWPYGWWLVGSTNLISNKSRIANNLRKKMVKYFTFPNVLLVLKIPKWKQHWSTTEYRESKGDPWKAIVWKSQPGQILTAHVQFVLSIAYQVLCSAIPLNKINNGEIWQKRSLVVPGKCSTAVTWWAPSGGLINSRRSFTPSNTPGHSFYVNWGGGWPNPKFALENGHKCDESHKISVHFPRQTWDGIGSGPPPPIYELCVSCWNTQYNGGIKSVGTKSQLWPKNVISSP